MRFLLVVAAALLITGVASAAEQPVTATPNTEIRLIHYRAHDGAVRPAWLFLPAGYHGQRVPLVISPHGRGVDESDNALFWGDLPGEGGFALIDPAGEGRRLHWYSWGDPGQIADLARMPQIARALGRERRTGTGSTRSAGRWAARRRCCSSRATRICSPVRRRSTRRPTWRAATATSRR